MSNKYHTGSYLVFLFDRYGTKTDSVAANSYTEGKEFGEANCGDGSFVLVRTVYNSLDGHPTAVRNFEDGEAL